MIELSALDQLRLLNSGKCSALELVDAYLAHIDKLNPSINAIVTLDAKKARAEARRIDQYRSAGKPLGRLAGLPIAIKDNELTEGMRTTFGSPIYQDFVPTQNSAMVQRFLSHDLNIIGKTNMPEFGLGSHTYNPIFGATRNPWDISRSAGGSSGGAAAAVACHMLPFADGSDLGGSLRNPASFNSVLGLRTSMGRVARYPVQDPFLGLTVNGPIARSAKDAALLLFAQCGQDLRDPLCLSGDGERFLGSLERDFKGVRIAFSPSLGGLPIEPEVSAATLLGVQRLQAMGCIIEELEPDLAGADEAFEVLRALALAGQFGAMLKTRRAQFKETAIWNIEAGLSLKVDDIVSAHSRRARLFQGMREFLEHYEFLVAPVAQVLPFAVQIDYPRTVAGAPMGHYLEWMRSCSRISITGHPAMSVPAGFSASGLPVGLQVVGRWQDEFSLLQLAHALEQVDTIAGRQAPCAPLKG